MKLILVYLVLLFVIEAHAVEIPQSVKDECSASEKIYNESEIRINDSVSRESKREAILMALGKSTSNPNYAVKQFRGQWFYEHENDEAVFAGYNIRSHYLSIAVLYTPKGLSTIICDSENLNQKKKSIHRKAPLWKETLNANLRVEIAKLSRFQNSSKSDLTNLNALKKKGFVTDEEFERIRNRMKDE